MPSGFREDRSPLFLARPIEVVSNYDLVGWKLIWLLFSSSPLQVDSDGPVS